jgi:tripartite-type tricarboxylate transporter receptor subunit TctC
MTTASRVAVHAAVLMSAGLISPALSPASADPVADFYKGRTVTVLASFDATGGFGLYAKQVADHIGKHIPGNPRVMPQYMPGAGGLKGANYFYNVSPRDGTVIATLSQTGPLFQRLKGQEGGFRYDFAKMAWLGRLTTMEAAVMGRSASGLTTLDSLKKTGLVACATGKSHQGYINAQSLAEVLDLKMKIVTGYKGSSDQLLAIERDECNMLVLSWDTWKTRGQRLVRDKVVTPLALVALERSEELPGVPATPELTTNPDEKRVLSFIASYASIGRAYALPPEVPADRVAAMQKAFVATYRDKEFLAATQKLKMDLNPAPGDVVRKYVMETVNAPDSIVENARKIMGM